MEVFEEAQPARRWLSSVQCHAGVIVPFPDKPFQDVDTQAEALVLFAPTQDVPLQVRRKYLVDVT